MQHIFERLLTGTLVIFLFGCQMPTPQKQFVTSSIKPELIPYTSYNIDFFRDIYLGHLKKDPVSLQGHLFLPAGEGRFPVVIYQHGSGNPYHPSYANWRTSVLNGLIDKKIGVFFADSYSGRGISDTAENQGQLSRATRIVDAFMALQRLSDHPRVDPERIGVMGTSFGGIVSISTSHEPVAEAVLPGGPRFAAHVPLYPGCTNFGEFTTTGAPTLMLLGGADDYTSPQPCIELADKMSASGAKIEVITYPGAHHGFISSKPVKWHPRIAHFNECPKRTIDADGEVRGPDATSQGKTWTQYVTTVFDSCGDHGVHTGRDEVAVKDALKRSISFFSNELKQQDQQLLPANHRSNAMPNS